jgi:hypothetical protein
MGGKEGRRRRFAFRAISGYFFPHIDAPRQVTTFSGRHLLDVWLTYRGNYPLFIHDMSSRILSISATDQGFP